MTTLNPALSGTSSISAGARTAAVIAFLFGALIVFTTGFAGPDAIHNASHDTRHAFALPCH